jgi:hypothetical protein
MCKFVIATLVMSLLVAGIANQSNAAGRSFEECQALALSHGVPMRGTQKVYHKYLRYKAAGTATNPKGLMARCMAGR